MHYFYAADISRDYVTLSSEESEHCVRVMRHRSGDAVRLTDGRGKLFDAEVVDANPKKCALKIIDEVIDNTLLHNGLHLAIAPTKNIARMEWLLEKAIEIGIYKITFLHCDHSERAHLNLERMQRIAISALKQSQTTWLPEIKSANFANFISENNSAEADKLIAWCDKNNDRQLTDFNRQFSEMILLIGPEGDFSEAEIASARQSGYIEVKLGSRRLRTETAGLYGCFAASNHK